MAEVKASANTFGTFLTEFNRAEEKRAHRDRVGLREEESASVAASSSRKVIAAIRDGATTVPEVMLASKLPFDEFKTALDQLRGAEIIHLVGSGADQKVELTPVGEKVAELYATESLR
jgi:predicted transcriptional regulator